MIKALSTRFGADWVQSEFKFDNGLMAFFYSNQASTWKTPTPWIREERNPTGNVCRSLSAGPLLQSLSQPSGPLMQSFRIASWSIWTSFYYQRRPSAHILICLRSIASHTSIQPPTKQNNLADNKKILEKSMTSLKSIADELIRTRIHFTSPTRVLHAAYCHRYVTARLYDKLIIVAPWHQMGKQGTEEALSSHLTSLSFFVLLCSLLVLR